MENKIYFVNCIMKPYLILNLSILTFILCSSCSEKKDLTNTVHPKELNIGDSLEYMMHDGEKLTLVIGSDGFDFLYLGNDRQFSINKSKKGLATLGSKLGIDRCEIADIDGDFYPDYKIDKKGTKELSVIENDVK